MFVTHTRTHTHTHTHVHLGAAGLTAHFAQSGGGGRAHGVASIVTLQKPGESGTVEMRGRPSPRRTELLFG